MQILQINIALERAAFGFFFSVCIKSLTPLWNKKLQNSSLKILLGKLIRMFKINNVLFKVKGLILFLDYIVPLFQDFWPLWLGGNFCHLNDPVYFKVYKSIPEMPPFVKATFRIRMPNQLYDTPFTDISTRFFFNDFKVIQKHRKEIWNFFTSGQLQELKKPLKVSKLARE